MAKQATKQAYRFLILTEAAKELRTSVSTVSRRLDEEDIGGEMDAYVLVEGVYHKVGNHKIKVVDMSKTEGKFKPKKENNESSKSKTKRQSRKQPA